VEWVDDMDPGTALRIKLKGEKMSGKPFTKTIMLTMGGEATGVEKLAGAGFEIRDEDGKIFIDNVMFSSPAEKAGIDFDQEILNIQVPAHRLPKELMYIPAGLLYALIWLIQNRRRKQKSVTVAT
jgi:hypothetical protein